MLVRPAGRALWPRREVGDIGLGGMRIYSDDFHSRGSRLEMELLLPRGDTVQLTVEVVWVDTLPPEGPARYDVGVRYVRATRETMDSLRGVLGDE